MKIQYEDIHMPKNNPIGMFIGGLSLVFGFAIIWHIIWLTILSFVGILILLIIRLTDDHTEYVITAAEIEKTENEIAKWMTQYNEYTND